MEAKKDNKKVNRYRWLIIIMFLVFAVLISKMVELQVIKG